jgi:hypothetical protein
LWCRRSSTTSLRWEPPSRQHQTETE